MVEVIMGYKDKSKQREYQKKWMAKRRAEYFKDKACAFCGSTEELQIHHKVRADKVTHNVWSFTVERMKKELAKCIVLCHKCHVELHVKNKDYGSEGVLHHRARLTEKDIHSIRDLYATGKHTQHRLGEMFGVCRRHISDIVRRKKWSHI